MVRWGEVANLGRDIGDSFGRMVLGGRGIDTDTAQRQDGAVSCGLAGFFRAIIGMLLGMVAMAKASAPSRRGRPLVTC